MPSSKAAVESHRAAGGRRDDRSRNVYDCSFGERASSARSSGTAVETARPGPPGRQGWRGPPARHQCARPQTTAGTSPCAPDLNDHIPGNWRRCERAGCRRSHGEVLCALWVSVRSLFQAGAFRQRSRRPALARAASPPLAAGLATPSHPRRCARGWLARGGGSSCCKSFGSCGCDGTTTTPTSSNFQVHVPEAQARGRDS